MGRHVYIVAAYIATLPEVTRACFFLSCHVRPFLRVPVKNKRYMSSQLVASYPTVHSMDIFSVYAIVFKCYRIYSITETDLTRP